MELYLLDLDVVPRNHPINIYIYISHTYIYIVYVCIRYTYIICVSRVSLIIVEARPCR